MITVTIDEFVIIQWSPLFLDYTMLIIRNIDTIALMLYKQEKSSIQELRIFLRNLIGTQR